MRGDPVHTAKETIGKFILCALQIGSGGSLGVEGPTVHIVRASAVFWRAPHD